MFTNNEHQAPRDKMKRKQDNIQEFVGVWKSEKS